MFIAWKGQNFNKFSFQLLQFYDISAANASLSFSYNLKDGRAYNKVITFI